MAENNIDQKADSQVIYVSIGLVSVIIIAALIIYGVGFTQQKQAASYENKIEGVDNEISQLEEIKEQALALGIQEEEINSLYQRQKSWSKAISALADNSLKSITFTQVSVDESAQVSMSGTAKSFLDINKQVVALNDSEAFSNIELTNITSQDNLINFSITATLSAF